MNSLNLIRVACSLVVKLPAQVIESHSVASPYIVGKEIARQIAEYSHKSHLGYYPALDNFRGTEHVDKDLLNAVESISWLVCNLVREEIQNKLRSVFSRTEFKSIQTVAYLMPTVRPTAKNALYELTMHYTPDQVRLNLEVTSVRKVENDPVTEVKLVKSQICRWLKNSFTHLELTSVKVLQDEDSD